MNFCSSCGSNLVKLVPRNDDRQRHVCSDCGTVHYQNPKIVTGCLPVWQESVLLCRRAIEPRSGYWTVPAGFMELNETVEQGAIRETWEEARARVELLAPYSMFNLTHVNQLYIIFRARLKDLDFRPGPESKEVRLFAEHEIPWDELAFGTVRHTLRFYFRDRPGGRFPLRTGTVASHARDFRFEAGPNDQLKVP
ncbi:MAG: NUDIX hydrolase [Gammaproteobacteria bacterium]|nr:NUDIX hydrolase [Gammaproteobacteria bacterium]NNK97570.1 NUDIX hydrolase [Xanthomonadales bacterium]